MSAGRSRKRTTAQGARKGDASSRIHQGLVGDRALVGTPYLADPVLRQQYAREIAPRTEVALGRILTEIFPDPRARQRPRRAADLGAGTGAAGQALRAYFGADLDVVELDRITEASPRARDLDITDEQALVALGRDEAPFDLAVAAHVLNELYVRLSEKDRVARLARLTKRWCEILLSEGGTLILIEPALRETSRTLLAVRDQLLGAGLHVVAPCFFTGPCPALVRARDWCHDTAVTEASRVDFSYLVVRTAGEPASDPALFRIVSDRLVEKGRLRLYACGASGRHPLVRLDREASRSNEDFARLQRGDVARIARTTFAQDGLRIVQTTQVSGTLRSR